MAEPELWTRCPNARERTFMGVRAAESENTVSADPEDDLEAFLPVWACLCHGLGRATLVRVSVDEMVERAARWWNEGLEPYPPRVAFIADLLRAALAPEEGT